MKKFIGFSLAFILVLILVISNSTSIINYIGEKLFLDFHQNKAAIRILKLGGYLDDNEDTYYTHYLLGRIYFVESRLQDSINSFEAAKKLNPNFKEIYYGLGLDYGFASSLLADNAEYNFKKYIEIDNLEASSTGQHAYGAWAAYNDLSWIYYKTGNFKKAEEVARQGLEITAGNPWLLNMLGIALLEQNRCTEALPLFEQAKSIMPNISSSDFGEAYSGDHRSLWEGGREKMIETINENMETCKSFPQE